MFSRVRLLLMGSGKGIWLPTRRGLYLVTFMCVHFNLFSTQPEPVEGVKWLNLSFLALDQERKKFSAKKLYYKWFSVVIGWLLRPDLFSQCKKPYWWLEDTQKVGDMQLVEMYNNLYLTISHKFINFNSQYIDMSSHLIFYRCWVQQIRGWSSKCYCTFMIFFHNPLKDHLQANVEAGSTVQFKL